MKVAISIPVHEKPDVVIDQINNIKKYVPDAVLVIHVSSELKEYADLERFIANENSVYMNPEHLMCGWGKIIDAHISNYKYLRSITDFDYIMFHASNDMYIRKGVEKYISQFDAGFHVHKVFKISRWWPSVCALEDPVVAEILHLIDEDSIVATQVESSFYSRVLFDEIVETIENARALTAQNTRLNYEKNYTREEVYFSTIANHLMLERGLHRGFPTTYSEVHDFDRALWKKQHVTWGIYHRLGLNKLIPRASYDKFEKDYSDRFAEKNKTALTVHKVKKLIKNPSAFLKTHLFLNDSVARYRLYGEEIFSVKRVPRDINNPLRVYINELKET
ncbi:hypothetical protein bpr_I0142 [Butyrivibrio proteoclasticus B316]|uniref:Uncharacterized protein n=1 Tax=Butyrivibrio proteoclasticus (strain ATCC 51982 / DSM 14932 / B316) TaxID=515622 RepID=E0RW26_BUTPB|nr:hypothetical protein [Butyrivibrio proteoclasticus]ADL32892.1 hypothetical protein bpr_I0142 [Butyrivibrio proteoclasticus B316]